MPSIVVRKTQGCPFCEMESLAEFNQKIYDREYPLAAIVIEARDRCGKVVEESEARAHRRHISNLEIDTTKLVEEKDLLNEDSSNLDVVKARLNRVRAILLQIENSGDWTITKDYAPLLGQFTKLMELKAKLEGGIVDKQEITVADIVAKLKEPEKQ